MTPDEHTNQEFFLDVGDGHQLYVQDWGKQDAKTPILFLHGGPGGGCKDHHKQRFTPEQQRVIFFDQRGAGKSLPKGELRHNTTSDLVNDIEKIVKQLKLDSFIVTGGSWGSTLALAYAVKHPRRIKAMVLQGISTGSQTELDYLNQGIWRTHFPEAWQAYLDNTPKAHHHDPTAYHFKRILGKDNVAMLESARVYNQMECALMKLDDRFYPKEEADFDGSEQRIEAHYFSNDCFLPGEYVLTNAVPLTMPIWLIHGRYDFVCMPENAYMLHQKLPNSQLIWTINGHHADHESWNVQRQILLQLTSE